MRDVLDDANPGSLRWAIGQVNGDTGTGADRINFDIPGAGPFEIQVGSSLPTLVHPAAIDGYSQPGSRANTLAAGDDATLMIVLNGAGSGGADGLTISAGASTVTGLAIQQFSTGIHLIGAGGDVVAGDFIGTDAGGRTAAGNYQGVLVDGSNGNTIGGAAPAARDLVSTNQNQNIFLIDGATGNAVEGDFVGLTAAGNATVPGYSYANGIIVSGAPGNTIGGAAPGARNVVAGQPSDGIQDNGSGGTLIEGNDVGTDATGRFALPNGVGIALEYGASGDTVGGTARAAANLISGNGGDGVVVQGGRTSSRGTSSAPTRPGPGPWATSGRASTCPVRTTPSAAPPGVRAT